MRKFLCLLFLNFICLAWSQSEQLAQNYYDRGEFEKAQIAFDELLKQQPNNYNYFQKSIDIYQQLEQFDKAQFAIQNRYDKYKQSGLLVELGYNFQLQKQEDKAKKLYDEALSKIEISPNEVYQVAYVFDRKTLTDYALKAYQIAIKKDPNLHFNYQMALLYGQKGDTDNMIEMFLTEAQLSPQSSVLIQNQLSRFLNEDNSGNFNSALKKALLIRIQKNQDLFWNQFLSWLYVQNKEYYKAFIQEKAIYKRDSDSFSNIVNLAQLAMEDEEIESATEILNFVLENTQDLDLQIQAHAFLINQKIKTAKLADYSAINTELDTVLKQFGISPYTLDLIQLKAHFTAFNLKKPEEAIALIKKTLDLSLKPNQENEIKMELADIFLFQEKFNQALLYYSQIETNSNNNPTGQEASLKIAKTSYYKEDFTWTEQQLKVLKSASTQLIANDALELFLLLNDAKAKDSTQTALKKFAKADFLLFQDKKEEALQKYKVILTENKGDAIIPIALLRIGLIYVKDKNYADALLSFQEIIDQHKESIYVDEALFFAGETYEKQNLIEKAKSVYEALILQHSDSIYFVNAQKKYRKLRGDNNT
jgi:tetratricopeptide (TPR) repeat protein